MKDDFWKALIKGMTPESSADADLWWKVPLIVLIGATIWAMII